LKYLGFAEVVFNKKGTFKIKNIKTRNLNYKIFIDYVLELICNEISISKNFETAKIKFYSIKTENDLVEFLTKVITFIWDNQNCEYSINNCIDKPSKRAVFLTMNNELKPIGDILIKEDFNEIIKDENLLIDIFKNKHIYEDYRSKLINKKLNQKLLKYKNKFFIEELKLKDLCDKIDKFIMKYDQTYNNNKVTYDNDFFKLISEVRKIDCEEKVKEELFPYFWKNNPRISITCLNAETANKLLSKINNENIDSQIKLLELFDDKKCIDKIISYGNYHGGISNFLKDIISPIDLKMNQKFRFILKSNEKGNETILESESIIFSPENININVKKYEYNNIIEFEIHEINDPSSNKKQLKIEYKKK
jgi:hypothetical protein